jgi:hypothetical protein
LAREVPATAQRDQRRVVKSETFRDYLADPQRFWQSAPTSDSACELRWHSAFEWGGRAKPVLGRLFGLAFAVGGRRDLNKLASLLESTAEPD